VGPGVEVGEASVLHPRVVLCEGVRLGCRVVVQAGAVIGGDGFGYVFDDGGHKKIPQVGIVVIEDDVDIGANTTIDRAMLGRTIIRRGTKIDNLVQVGHNVEIGEHSIIVAQVGISGSCRLGRGVIAAGQVGFADHLTIGDGAVLGAQAGVAEDVPAGERGWARRRCRCSRAKRLFACKSTCRTCPAVFAPRSAVSSNWKAVSESPRRRPVRREPWMTESDGIHSTCVVDAKANLAAGVRIGAFSIIGPEVTIGADARSPSLRAGGPRRNR